MKGYRADIEKITEDNKTFRNVLYTGKHIQLVVMSLAPGEEIGFETHDENDQFLRFESGEGRVIIDDTEYSVGDGVAVVVPVGAKHNVINTSESAFLKLYTIYGPPHHKDGTMHMSKQDAQESDEEFDGVTSE